MMTHDTLYARSKEVFLRVCDAPEDTRDSLMRSLCGGDDGLVAEVEALLGHDDDHDTLCAGEHRPPGSRVGKYIIRGLLGAGSMGLVYEGELEHPKRTVAIKIGRAGVRAASLRRRMEHEVAALARLQHPGIAAVYDTGVDEGTGEPYFVMEMVRGEPITAYAGRRGLSIQERAELVAEVCDAVHHAHLRGVIHRDLKPSNILVDETGRARVLDFGIARLTDEEATVRTMPGQVVGTLGYMSPEQAAGDRDGIDARTDIYALGSIAYELLAGRAALDLDGRSVSDAVRRIQEVEPARLGAVDRRLRGDAETVVAKAMEKDPSRWYQSAESLGADLRRMVRNEPVLARGPSTLYQLAKFARRHRGLVAGVGAVASAMIGATVVSGIFAVRADSERAVAQCRFAQVRALANTFLFDVYGQVETLPGSLEVRQNLVGTGLTYLDSLAADAEGDPELLAEAYSRIGDLQGNPLRSNLGEPMRAIDSYERGIRIRERIERIAPSLENRVAMLRTYLAMGEAVTSSGRAEDALAHFTKARDGLAAESLRSPDSAALVATVYLAESNIGSVLRDMGRPEEALVHFLNALGAARTAKTMGSATPRTVSVAYNEAGLTLVRLGREAEAVPHFERSMEIRKAELERNPQSTRARRDLALAHHRMSDAVRVIGEFETAILHNRSAFELLHALHQADPGDARLRIDLSIAREKVASSLLDAGRFEEALPEHHHVLELRTILVDDHPENLYYRKALMAAQERLAHNLRLLGRHAEARPAYTDSIALAHWCRERDARDTRVWTSLAAAQRGLGLSAIEQAAGTDLDLLKEGAAWFDACLATIDHMQREGIVPVRPDLTTENIRALKARSEPEGD